MSARRVATLALAAVLAGCTVGPDFTKPVVDTPPAWRIDYPQAADVANTRWWEQFGDPVLTGLIDTALRENRDLVIAAARVDAYIGTLETTRAKLYPQADYNLDASRNRASGAGASAPPAGTDPYSPGYPSLYSSQYQGVLGAKWQVDLFGRVRRQAESAQARVYATEQGRRGVVLSVVCGVAASYVALRSLDKQLEIAQQTAKNYAETQRIFELRYKGGVVSKVELAQNQSAYQQALAAIPALEQQIAAQENLIAVLLGRNPFPIPRGRPLGDLSSPELPGNLPASLLERRPDILQAEQNLIAANADIGAAKALYYPQFNLTANYGSISAAFSNFLTGPAAVWLLAANLTGPLFTAGSIAGQVATAEAQSQEALGEYQKTVLVAFREANDALVGTIKKREENAAQALRVAALRETARLTRLRFNYGSAGFFEVLYAENELFAGELAAVRTNADRYTQIIAVYKAVGGGWIDLADQGTAAGRLPPVPERAAQQPLF